MTEVPLYPIGRAPKERVCGELLVYGGFVSPLGDVDPETGRLRGGGALGGKVVAVKGFTGSTVGPYVVYSLKKRGLAPRALVVEQLDANAVASAVVAGIPLYRVDSLSEVERLYGEGLRFVCAESGRLRPRGLLIAVEGVDGAGKTTVSKRLRDILERCGFRAVYTYEPYYDAVRSIFESRSMELTPAVEALLLVADRYSHYESVIRREVERGSVVVLDRYKYSTIAYQGAAGLPIEWLLEIQRYLPDPDLAIYLDVDPEEGLRRKAASGPRSLAYFEEDVERIRRAREIYLGLASEGKLVLVDARVELSKVMEKVVDAIEERLGLDLRECSRE